MLAWVNDEDTKRAYDSSDDAYRVFRKMLERGYPPDHWDQLLAEAGAEAQRLQQFVAAITLQRQPWPTALRRRSTDDALATIGASCQPPSCMKDALSPMKVSPTGKTLGACVEGLDLSVALSSAQLDAVMQALGQYGVLRFPAQALTAVQLKAFSAQLGDLEINVAGGFQEPGLPEVMVLSNMVENGKPVGLSDAGQGWHTDMSYSRQIAFANVLYGIRIPKRYGRTLGNTSFCNMHAAYDDLPEALKTRLDGMTVLHDFAKFWDMMRLREGSRRGPLTVAQRQAKPPVSHPIFLTHPLTGRKVLYANPGYSMRINQLPEAESKATLEFLFAHQTQAKYRYDHVWSEQDLLVWEDFGTIHNAVADYGPDEHRLIKRCQVMASRFFRDGEP